MRFDGGHGGGGLMAGKTARGPDLAARPRRILVVDDEPMLVDLVVEHLRDSHYEVETATNGRQALAAVARQRPDVVLLDITMPGLSGIDVLKEIVKTDPSITVIMVSGNTDVAVTAEAIRNGAFSYVPKPFDFRYLRHFIAASLGA
ncbi:MAG TPA: response regulator [Methylomirabilota bacterium]|nr:response regulator [Methylomirabilota bacterium]